MPKQLADSGQPAVYNTTPLSLSDGDTTALNVDASQNLKTTLGTEIAGEDIINDLTKVEQRFSSYYATADANIKAAPGFLHTITFWPIDATATAGTIIFYNNTVTGGTVIGSYYVPAAYVTPFTVTLDVEFTTGLYVDFTTTTDIGVTVSYR